MRTTDSYFPSSFSFQAFLDMGEGALIGEAEICLGVGGARVERNCVIHVYKNIV